jgi:hypothetical protein
VCDLIGQDRHEDETVRDSNEILVKIAGKI